MADPIMSLCNDIDNTVKTKPVNRQKLNIESIYIEIVVAETRKVMNLEMQPLYQNLMNTI